MPKSLFENPGSSSERVIRARLARPQPEDVPAPVPGYRDLPGTRTLMSSKVCFARGR